MDAEFVWERRLYIYFRKPPGSCRAGQPQLTASVYEQFWFPESWLSVIVLLKMTSKTQTSIQEAAGVSEETPLSPYTPHLPTPPTPGPALRTVVFKHILRSREANVLERMFPILFAVTEAESAPSSLSELRLPLLSQARVPSPPSPSLPEEGAGTHGKDCPAMCRQNCD